MGIREVARSRWGGRLAAGTAALNARHPWSHNDHFHPWIVTRLPAARGRALDVGCGRGELLATLAQHLDHVTGLDPDPEMRLASAGRCAGLDHVEVTDTPLHDLDGSFDVVTMVAVLHHLDLERALLDVRRLLAPGGRFLCVGLARPASVIDHAWDLAAMATNPVIGYVKHPWAATGGRQAPAFPVADPRMSLAEMAPVLQRVMPGARVRHRLGFRHTIEWTRGGAVGL